MKNQKDWKRREFLKVLGGLGAISAVAGGGWGLTEILASRDNVKFWKKSVCRYCGTGCGVQIGFGKDKIVSIRGDKEAHNKGVICIKGALLAELPKLENRLTSPKIRKNGKLVDATWDEAMNLVAKNFGQSIKNHGPDSVAFYGSGQLFIEESYTANKLFKGGIGTNNVESNARLCMASAAVGYTQTFGKDEPPGCYEDLDYADCFFIFGANPYECHPPLFERIQQRKYLHPKTKIICVDPRKSKTAERSDVHLAVTPGTDLLLLNAMAYTIIADGLFDKAFVEQHVKFSDGEKDVTFEDFVRFINDYNPETVSRELGISPGAIREASHVFAKSKATVSLWTMGANQRYQGVSINTMLCALHLVTGHIGRPGATPLSLTGQSNACGGIRDTGALSHILPGGRLVKNPTHRKEMERLWNLPPGKISPKPGYDTLTLFKAMGEEKVKAALVMCTNPAQSLPNLDDYRKGMEKCFLVVADIFEDTKTALYADVLLPAALWIEKEGIYGQTERRYQIVEKLLNPPGQARSDLEILIDFADRLGYGDIIKAKLPEQVWDEWRQVSKESYYDFSGMTYKRLKANHGLQWPCPSQNHPGTKRRYVGGDDPFVSPGKKMEFYGHKDKRAVVYLRPYTPSPERTTREFPLYLTTGRVVEHWHTATMTGRIAELKNAAGEAAILINPIDARRLSITEGSVVVRSRYGSLQGKAKISDETREGVLFAAFFDAKFLINRIVSDHKDPVSKEPAYKVTAVSIQNSKV